MLNLNKNEILRYLGYKNQELDPIVNGLIEDSMAEIQSKAKIGSIYKEFEIIKTSEGLELAGSNFILKGSSIEEHLRYCESCVLMAFTLGHDIDRLIRYYQKISMNKAIILDACASTAIEEVGDILCEKLDKEYVKKGKNLTSRFSPGYGDLSIEIQGAFLDLLNAKRTIGIGATSHNILIPRKSVTAIVGISNKEIGNKIKRCIDCSKYGSCNFSKGDEACGAFEKTRE